MTLNNRYLGNLNELSRQYNDDRMHILEAGLQMPNHLLDTLKAARDDVPRRIRDLQDEFNGCNRRYLQ